MPELSDAVTTNSTPEMSSILENIQQKHKLNTTTRQNVINSSSSSIKETSSSSQQVNDMKLSIVDVFLLSQRMKSQNFVFRIFLFSFEETEKMVVKTLLDLLNTLDIANRFLFLANLLNENIYDQVKCP